MYVCRVVPPVDRSKDVMEAVLVRCPVFPVTYPCCRSMIPASVSSPFLSPIPLVLLSKTMASFSPLFHFLMLDKSFFHLLTQRLKIYRHCSQGLLPHSFPDCCLLPFAGILNLGTVFWRASKFISSLFFTALVCFICVSLESETKLQQFRC